MGNTRGISRTNTRNAWVIPGNNAQNTAGMDLNFSKNTREAGGIS